MARGGTKTADAEDTGEATETEAVNQSSERRVREIVEDDGPPTELRGRGGGRTRTPTEFDDQIESWNNGKWKRIPVEDEADLKYVYNAVKRAVDSYNEDHEDAPFGVERLKDPGESEKSKEMGTWLVWVKVRPKQKRGPAVGSARIDGKVYGPGEWHTDENGTKVPNAPAEAETADAE